jgi:hypothetical protein
VRVDAARGLKEIVALKGDGRTYAQEALVNLSRPDLDTSDEAKKNALEYLVKMVDSADDCVICIRIGGIPALIALASSLKNSGGMEQAKVSSWRVLKKLTAGGLPADWTKFVASELCIIAVEGVRSVCGYTSRNIKREREAAATTLELLTKKEPASHPHVASHAGAVASLKSMADDMHPTMEQGRDSSRRVLRNIKV